MEAPQTNTITVGSLELTPHGQIYKKDKPMTETGKWKTKDFLAICQWITTKTNATKLSHNSNHTWVECGSLRLDSQLISKDSPFYNCAIQLNTGGGASSKSESYSSVLIHGNCFTGTHLAHLAAAVSRAHTESNSAGRIFHIVPAVVTVATPVVVAQPKTCVCPHCGKNTPLPEYSHANDWGVCGHCDECFQYPEELFV